MVQYTSIESVCLKVFVEVAKVTSVFIMPLFLGRIVFANITGQGQNAFTVLKSALTYFCLIAIFPYILEILFSIPENYLPRISNTSDFATEFENTTGAALLPFALDRVLEVILAMLYWCAYYLHILFMLVMCSMAPIVFLTSTMLGMGLGIEIFMGLLIVGSSWPIIWYGFDQIHSSLIGPEHDTFATKCLEILITVFKGFSPIAFASLAIKSPAGQAVARGIQAMDIGGGNLLAGTGYLVEKGFSRTKKSYENLQRDKSQTSTKSNLESGQKQESKKPKRVSSRLEKARLQQVEKEK